MSKRRSSILNRRRVRHAVNNSDIDHLGKGRALRLGWGAGPKPHSYGDPVIVDSQEIADEVEGLLYPYDGVGEDDWDSEINFPYNDR